MSLITPDKLMEAKANAPLVEFKDMTANLRRNGFCSFSLYSLGLGELELVELSQMLGMMASDLPEDPYGGKKDNRYRRYARFVLVPRAGELVAVMNYDDDYQPICHYRQPPGHHSEFGNLDRRFPSYPPRFIEKGAFASLITALYKLAIAGGIDLGYESIEVGAHIIEMRPGTDAPSLGSPNHQHTDGEPITIGILLNRKNVKGGKNYITKRHVTTHWRKVVPDDVHAVFTLENFGDGWAIDDKKVSHGVTEVEIENPGEPASRIILLVDFTPLIPSKTEGALTAAPAT